MSKKSPEFEVIDDEEMLKAVVAESKAKTLSIMESGLKSYLKKMGKDSTFKGWIAHDYPENIDVDKRLTSPYNDWELVWNKTTSEHFKSKKNILHNLLQAKGISYTKRRRYKSSRKKYRRKHKTIKIRYHHKKR